MTKIVKALEDSDVLMKGITQTLKNDIKKGGALPLIPMLLGTLGASLLTGRGLFGQGIKKRSLTPFHPLTNFEIIAYFKGVKGFNGVYSRDNLPKLKKRSICH